jgi:hypothetical protein
MMIRLHVAGVVNAASKLGGKRGLYIATLPTS